MKMSRGDRNAALAEWYLHGRQRGIWMLPVTAGLSLFIVLMLLRGLASDPRANGISSAAEFQTYVRTVPDDRNALVALREARKSLVAWNGNSADSPLNQIWGSKDVLKDPAVVSYWKNSQRALQEIRTALTLPDAEGGYDYMYHRPNVVLSLFEQRETSCVLALDLLMQARHGNHATAAESLAAIHRLTEHINRDPALISLMVSCGTEDASIDSLYWILRTQQLSETDLERYAKALRPPRDPYSLMARCYQFERRYLLYHMDATQLKKSWLTPQLSAGGSINAAGPLLYGSDREASDRTYQEIIGTFERKAIPDEITKILARHQRGPAIVSHIGLPSIARTHMVVFQTEDQIALLNVAIAVSRFQQKYQRDPIALTELVPVYLQSVPQDVYGGQPIRIRKLTEPMADWQPTLFYQSPEEKQDPLLRLLLYTSGKNRIDEQGLNKNGPYEATDDDTTLLLRVFAPPLKAGKP